MANFLNQMVSAMGDRLNAKFNPSSPTFAQGGALAGMGHQSNADMDAISASIGPIGMGAAAEQVGATPEKERMARSMGFRDYDTMIAFERNKQVRRGNSPTTGAGQAVRQAPGNAMAAHPKSIFQYITDALAGNPNK